MIDLKEGVAEIFAMFKQEARPVRTDTWQGYDIKDRPEALMFEVLRVTTALPIISEAYNELADAIEPNLPWADTHFHERVCQQPLNPGQTWRQWPWAQNADHARVVMRPDGGELQFNHTYMERYWPDFAGQTPNGELSFSQRGLKPIEGIRREYGNLLSLVDLLVKDPFTRQAWIPIFFPEDTGIADSGRKPCSLGYQFIRRGDTLNVYYPLRSCDIYRHLRDDIYLTMRLVIWVLRQCRQQDAKAWDQVKPGILWFWATSLHCFRNDWKLLYGKDADEPS